MLKCRKLCFSDEGQGEQFRNHLFSYSTNPPFSTSPKFPLHFLLCSISQKLCCTFILLFPQFPFASRYCSAHPGKKAQKISHISKISLLLFFTVFIMQFLLIQKYYQKCFYSAELLKSKKVTTGLMQIKQRSKKLYFGRAVWEPQWQVLEVLKILCQWKL